MKMPKNVDLSKLINREKVIEPSIANNEKNIGCPPLTIRIYTIQYYTGIFLPSRDFFQEKQSYVLAEFPLSKYKGGGGDNPFQYV